MNSLKLVEAMAALSSKMRGAASTNDWTALSRMNQEFAALREALSALEPGGQQSGDVSVTERDTKARLIRQILDDNAAMRAEVIPALESTRKLITPNTAGNTMRAAYRAHQG